MNDIIIYSTNLGAIIGGVIGGLVVLGAITTMLLRGRSKENTGERAELDPEPKEITLDPGPAGEGSPHPLSQSSGTQITRLATGIPDLVPLVSPIPAGIAFLRRLTSTSHDTQTVAGHRSSASNLSSSRREQEAAKQPPIVLALQEVSSSGTISEQPARELAADTQGHIPNTQLTDEQVDFVNSLWSANVPATDIARVMERMRVTGGQGAGSREMRDDDRPDIAPPSYDGLGYRVGEEG